MRRIYSDRITLIEMANFRNQLPAFLHPSFESKARAVFGIPEFYYLSNDELGYYFSLLSSASTDEEARFERVLTCDTNPACNCFFCGEHNDQDYRDQSGDYRDQSDLSVGGEDADDELTVSTPSVSILRSSGSSNLQYSYALDDYDTSTWSTGPGSPADESSVIFVGVDSPPERDDSVICLGSDPSVVPIEISSDDSVVASTPVTDRRSASSSLRDLEEAWSTEFGSNTTSPDTIKWSPAVGRKRPRRGLYYNSIPAKIRAVVPVDISPIK